MSCQETTANSLSDKLEKMNESRSSDLSAGAWLAQQGVKYLHTADKEGEYVYKLVIELLSRHDGAADTIVRLIHAAPKFDTNIKWSLLHLLGDFADSKAAGWLAQYSVAQLPERGEGCESPRDMELLLRTMAIESLKKIATRHPESSDYLLKIISEKHDPVILIEIVKAAVELGHRQKVEELLPKDLHWILEIKKARVEEMYVDTKLAETNERGFTPPKSKSDYTTPSVNCGCKKGENHG